MLEIGWVSCVCYTQQRYIACAKLFPASFSQDNKGRPFVIKPISSPLMKPLLVFVNPKSGGNQVRTSHGSRSQSDNSVSADDASSFCSHIGGILCLNCSSQKSCLLNPFSTTVELDGHNGYLSIWAVVFLSSDS